MYSYIRLSAYTIVEPVAPPGGPLVFTLEYY